MSETYQQFSGTVPDSYNRQLGPLLFEPYAAQLAALSTGLTAAMLPVSDVLELAAGTGILTRALAAVLPEASIVATDLSADMVAEAARHIDAPNVRWEQADATSLPFPDDSFDLVVCQFGVIYLPDRSAAYADVARVLRRGGELVLLTWDRVEHNPVPATVHEALGTVFPDDPPTFMVRVPHGYHDPHVIADEIRAGGLRVDTVEALPGTARAVSARQVAEGFCLGTPLRHEIVTRDAARLDEAVDTVERLLVDRFGAGPFDAPMSALLVTATATG